jgi:hypothetical protein
MIGKLVMVAMVVLGLRWMASGAPVSERTAAADRPVSAQRCDCDCANSGGMARALPNRRETRDAPRQRPPDEGVVSEANEAKIKEVGSEVWAIARPLLKVAADKALDGIAALLHSAADKVAQSHPSSEASPVGAGPD